MLSQSQIEWASRHDWFIEAYDGFIAVWDICTHRGVATRKLVYHYDYETLRAWAGY